ncbi:MAG: PEP-CTERM sorting domain-containing protein [Acidobacteriota bacterium]
MLVADTGLQALSGIDVGGTVRFTADFRSVVYRDPGTGFLSFLYQLTNTGGGTADSIGRITTIDFGTPTVTDVGFCSACADLLAGVVTYVDPDFVSRSGGSGSVIEFAYSVGGAHLAPLESSSVLIINTMSTLYAPGSTSVQDGGTVNANSFQPVDAAVPEPSTMGLALLGIAGLLALHRRRSASGRR